jgi:non-ribosomal peptide synthase protein (TIGR01720 family)
LGLVVEKVGIRDDFFRLGGDSIVSIQLVSRLRQRLNLSVSIKDIFTYKTIERLYENVLKETKKIDVHTEQGKLSGEVELLPIQEWFFESKFAKQAHWNQSFIVKVFELDIDELQRVISKLADHHDALSLRYKRAGRGRYIQYYDKNSKVPELKILDVSTLERKEGSEKFYKKLEDKLTKWQSEFNLEQGPMFNIGYLYGYKDGSARVVFALHHLIVDAVSWRILVDDLRSLYEGKALGLKGSSYRQWVNTVREYGKSHEEEREYWDNVLRDREESKSQLLELLPSEDTKNHSSLALDHKQTRLLLQDSNRAYNTEINDILLTAFGCALKEVTGSKVNHIVLEGHGREEIDDHIDITHTVGWFTTMYPVKLEVSEDIGDSLKDIKETLRRVPNKGIGYGALVGKEKETLPRISFNYLGQFDNKEGATDTWKIINESSGISVSESNEDHNIINVNGWIINSCLQFEIVTKLDKGTTDRLTTVFAKKLKEILDHTVSQRKSYLTVSDVGKIISQEYLDKLQKDREIEGVYLANSLQEGFIYHALNQGEIDDAYKIQLIWEYHSEINVDRLKEAWSYAQSKYPTLRMRFAWDSELVQVIDKNGELDFRYIDLSKETEETQEEKLKEIQISDRSEAYRLEEGNLFRVYIIKRRQDSYTCMSSNHHAILDGWSGPILFGYVHETYLKLLNKEHVNISVDHSYEEAQKYLQSHKESNREYWDNYVGQIEERVDLTGLLSGENKQERINEYRHIKSAKELSLSIKDELYNQLKALSRSEGVTINAILQYVWHKLLSVYGNTTQTVVGTTISGRNLPINDIENSVGLYINTLPLIVNHSDGVVIEAIRAIQENINEINTRSEISLAKLQKGGERLFDSLFVYENYPNPTSNNGEDTLHIRFKESVEKLDYPLGIMAYEGNGEVILKIDYAGELFNRQTIEEILSVCKKLLEQISNNPIAKVEELRYLPQDQYKEIVYSWNETDKAYPDDKTLHELFEEQVTRRYMSYLRNR